MRHIAFWGDVRAHYHSFRELEKMCSKYNRLLLSTCIQIFAFGALANIPAHAEFKWTPPDESDYVEDLGPDVFMGGEDDMSSDMQSGSALPEYYDTPQETVAQEISPPTEIKALEDNEEESFEMRTINLSEGNEVNEPIQTIAPQEEPEPDSLVLNPYPLKDDGLTLYEEGEESSPERAADKDAVSYDVIEGFGMDMPLALALRQIVPPEYAYSFGDNVNPGARVSWEGGKPWNDVLNESLAPLGFEAFVHNKRVILQAGGGSSEHVVAAPEAQKKNELSEPIKKLAEAELGENGAEELSVTTEETMSASLEEEAFDIEAPEAPETLKMKTSSEDILAAPATSESVALDKTHADEGDDNVNALVDDLMEPLESFEDSNSQETEGAGTDEPPLKPEIILDEQEAAEEEYAKKLEQTNPFDGTEGHPDQYNPENARGEATGRPILMPMDGDAEEIIPEYSSMIDAEDQVSITFEDSEEITASEGKDIPVDEEPEKENIRAPLDKKDAGLIDKKMAKAIASTPTFREEPSNKILIWQAKRSSNLKDILAEWSEKERVSFVWEAKDDYVLDYDVFISGTYKNAIDILFKKGLKRAPKYVLSEAPYSISVLEE